VPDYDSIKAALSLGEIKLHYQPIHNLSTGQLEGYEALARWGKIPPPAIANLIEEHSLQAVWIQQQLADVDAMLASAPPPLWVSLNLNQKALALPGLAALLAALPHHLRVHVEILESVRLTPASVAVIKAIALQHTIKADDIGSSEHGGLDRIVGEHGPLFHGIKLCRGLTQNILTDERTATACRLLLEFAETYDLMTTAEWVECEEQADQLRDWGCDLGQGALYGLAIPWDAIARAGKEKPPHG